MEGKEILVEACLPNIHDQVSFHDPYAHFLQTFEEGSRVFSNNMLPAERRFFEAAILEQEEEIPLNFKIQEESDQAFKSHIEDAVESAKIKAAQDEDSGEQSQFQIKEGLGIGIDSIRRLMTKMPQKKQKTARKQRKFGNGKTRTKCESITGRKLQNKIWKPGGVQMKNNVTNGCQQSKVWDPGGEDSLVYYIVHYFSFVLSFL